MSLASGADPHWGSAPGPLWDLRPSDPFIAHPVKNPAGAHGPTVIVS